MRIHSLSVRNVRRHADLTVSFAPGVTVVCGPNEAGKSTLQRAIEMALFRSATSTSQDLTDLRSWGAPPENELAIELCFEADGVEGRLVKSFARSAGTVLLELGEQTLSDPRLVDQTMAELTGLPSEKFYRSTAGIRHAEMTALDGEGPELRDRLQQAISGADRGTAQARRELEGVIRQYRSEGAKNPGVLKRTRDEISRLLLEVATGERQLEQLERDRATLAGARTRKADLDGRLTADQTALTQVEGALELVRRATDGEQRFLRYKRAAEIRDELARLDGTHPSATPLPELKSVVDRLRQLEYELSEVRAELAGEPDPSMQQPLPTPAGASAWFGAAAGLGVLGVLAVLATAVLGAVAILLGAALFVAAVALGWIGARRRHRMADIRQGNALLAADVKRRVDGRSERQDALRRSEREREGLLASIGATDLPAAEASLDAESRHVAQIEQLRAEQRGLLGDAPRNEDPAVLRDAAAADAEKARFALSGMGADGRDLVPERTQLRASVDATRRQRDAALGEEGQAQGRVQANVVDAEAVARATEQLAQAEERLRLSERRLRIYQTTLDAIATAEQQTMKKAARVLEETMGRDVATITDGRYRRIEVDEGSLAFRVYSVERGDWIPASSLSHGTRDQLYLAARLGLVRQITGDHQPPLILDDPFVSFDDARARRAVELLRQVGADFQVILLTCSTRYDELADSVIRLPAPELRDEAGQVAVDPAVPSIAAANPAHALGEPALAGPAPAGPTPAGPTPAGPTPAAAAVPASKAPRLAEIPEPPAPGAARTGAGTQPSLWDEPETTP